MEDAQRYYDEIIKPTLLEFRQNPSSRRHLFLVCVALNHVLDYLAARRGVPNTQELRRLKSEFHVNQAWVFVEGVANAFKHVLGTGNRGPGGIGDLAEGDVQVRSNFSLSLLSPVRLITGGLGSCLMIGTKNGNVALYGVVNAADEFVRAKLGIEDMNTSESFDSG
jgi:hypothetical protein